MGVSQIQDAYATQRSERERFLGTLKGTLSYVSESTLRTIETGLSSLGWDSTGFSYEPEMLGNVHVQDDAEFLKVLGNMREFVCERLGNAVRDGESTTDIAALYDEILRLRDSTAIVTSSNLESVFRHSFVSMMAFFDASVFDLSKDAIRSNFDHVGHLANNRTNRTFGEMSTKQQTEKIDDIATELLRRLYIRKLVHYLLKNFSLGEQNNPSLLIESLSRRNGILHSASIADQKYIDDSEGNPCSVSIGEPLHVSDRYLSDAEDVCEQFLNKMSEWIRNGATIQES